jgi:allophanate hydrolase
LLLPTAGTIYKIADIDADPVRLNSNLGYYTNFMNLLQLCAVATPAGFAGQGLPFGVTLCAPEGHDYRLLQLADRVQRARVKYAGSGFTLSDAPVVMPQGKTISIAVCGAHLSGLPLNGQLLERAASLREKTMTAACYRLYALVGGPPYRPGLVRDTSGQGAAIDIEVWDLPEEKVGGFIKGIPAPLGIGKVELASGEWVSGFICEPAGITGAEEITHFGGWRAYVQSIGS